MNDPCWYKLNIDLTNCFKKDYRLPKVKGRYGIWHPLATEVFSEEWLDYTKSIGFPIYSVMIFYRGPNAATKGAHIDLSESNGVTNITNWGINWCYGGKGSTMSWYEPLPNSDPQTVYTAANTPYKIWRKDVLNKIESHHIGDEVTLVKTGIPHSIEMGTDPRWCFSARTSMRNNYPWDKLVEYLKSKNLLIE
jgi:hypothetical protein